MKDQVIFLSKNDFQSSSKLINFDTFVIHSVTNSTYSKSIEATQFTSADGVSKMLDYYLNDGYDECSEADYVLNYQFVLNFLRENPYFKKIESLKR